MALLKYFLPSLPKKVLSITEQEVEEATAGISKASPQRRLEQTVTASMTYSVYGKRKSTDQQVAAEHGPAQALCHCSKLLGRQVQETTARRLKPECRQALKRMEHECADNYVQVNVQSMPTKGLCPLLYREVDSVLDHCYMYVTSWRSCQRWHCDGSCQGSCRC